MVIDDIEIYRCAKYLLDNHGDEAFAIAEMKFQALAESEDLEGCAVWRQVAAALRELRRKSRGRDEPVN